MDHQLYMQRCLELAQHGLRDAMPNPSVGAVLIHNGRIIGESYTSAYGGPHGEVNCISSVAEQDRHLIPEATLYVSLEPCSHYGKTPPCCDLIINQGIKNIVIGTADPHEKVAGNGIKKLREAGRNVVVGVLEQECREMNRRFFTYHEKKRPYSILKWAESKDKFIAPLRQPDAEKKPVWVTYPYSRQLVHKWRSEEMAILAGTKTVLDDNPNLDVRDWSGPNPVRVVLDRQGSITPAYSVKNLKIKTIILTEQENCTNLENLIFEKIAFDEHLPRNCMEVLYKHNLISVIIEGGRQTLQAFIDAGLWDEARIFTGDVSFREGTPAPFIKGDATVKKYIGADELVILRNYDQYNYI
ncbi:riboflavin biosynthesis protein RibD [Flavobacterium cyanobacteriorum]|uniref:Riboflavin biosynthesis protein RibD n=1 Tax=Flavobacterium cyanobacteriorum TaxID=2022802 RepID=A0A255ZA63_9FLAO|nr:bifunctional diaminohydroxyphosphoribosylaminopyrimidine deaminase/5-amino-6-(5-phosphoribosylamino)uracil reductase RibD [Flavobacterium cyanobacteriorum]OYQ37755.1 riboflavin biosynthesis protein RibD [Flavobacterium cyanobacteriorum]